MENVQILMTGTAARSASVLTPYIILEQGRMGNILNLLDYMLLWGIFMCIVCTEQLDLVKCLHILQGVVIRTQAKEASVKKKKKGWTYCLQHKAQRLCGAVALVT